MGIIARYLGRVELFVHAAPEAWAEGGSVSDRRCGEFQLDKAAVVGGGDLPDTHDH